MLYYGFVSKVAKVNFVDYEESVALALELVGAGERLCTERLIIIKPNLTNADGPPVTTHVEAVEAVYKYCRRYCQGEIAIGEGCGSGITADAFAANGYTELAAKYSLELIDFNEGPAELLRNERALQLKEFYLPTIAKEAFVISVPILKDHSFTVTTIAMKNMFGLAPGRYYSGSWNKSKLHSPSTHKSVVDVCLYKRPDLCVVDAKESLTGMHLAGTAIETNVILAGFDPVAIDAVGSELLGHEAKKIEYLRLAEGVLGSMEGVEILTG